MKILALNVDFDGSSFYFLGSRKPAHEGIKERYSRTSLSWKRLQICMGMLLITTTTSDELFSQSYQHRWLWETLNYWNKGFLLISRSSAAAHTIRMNCDEMAERDWQFANRNWHCYRLSRVSLCVWVHLMHISLITYQSINQSKKFV